MIRREKTSASENRIDASGVIIWANQWLERSRGEILGSGRGREARMYMCRRFLQVMQKTRQFCKNYLNLAAKGRKSCVCVQR